MAKFGKKVVRPNKNIKSEVRDTVRKGNSVLNTDIYPAVITKAYIQETPAGANMIKAEFKTDSGKVLRLSECFQSGDEKNNQIFYEDRDGNEHYLPGWDILTELLAAGLGDDAVGDDGEITDVFTMYEDGDVENKKIMLYDFNKKKDTAQKRPVIVPLVGKSIRIGVQEVFLDIPKKDNSGKIIYKNKKTIPSGKYIRTNKIDKFFNSDTGQTCNELLDDTDAKFYKDWLAMKDHVYDYTANKIAPVKDGKVIATTNDNDDDSGSKRSTKSLFKK